MTDSPNPNAGECLLQEGGRYRYRCADGGHQAILAHQVTACLWHGEECIDWFLQVPAENGPVLSALLQRHDEAVRDAAYLGRLAASSSWPGEMAYRVQKVADRAADRLAALDREVPDDPR